VGSGVAAKAAQVMERPHRTRNALTMKAILTIPVLVLLIAQFANYSYGSQRGSPKPETPDFGPTRVDL